MALPADRDVTYKAFRRFNTDPPPIDPHSRARVVRELERWFGGDSLEEKLARALVLMASSSTWRAPASVDSA